jgi:hypothetical protein
LYIMIPLEVREKDQDLGLLWAQLVIHSCRQSMRSKNSFRRFLGTRRQHTSLMHSVFGHLIIEYMLHVL